MNRCIVIPSYVEGKITNLITAGPDDLVVCADAGLLLALAAGFIPHAVIGDMDSLAEAGFQPEQLPPGIEWLVAPKHKDLTDTALCMEYGMQQGCKEIILVGGLGGRFDHTFANLQNMVGYCGKEIHVTLLDENTRIHLLTDSRLVLSPPPGFSVSVFSWSPVSTGVTLTGMTFPLTNATLTHDFPLGVSNQVLTDAATISVKHGTLLVVCSRT